MLIRRFSAITLVTTLIIPIIPLLLLPQPGQAQAPLPALRERFFPETGYAVPSPFLETWESTPNALFILGMPISHPFMEEDPDNPGTYTLVQYFERAVLEVAREQTDNGEHHLVQRRLLGSMLAAGREHTLPFQPIPNPPDKLWFAETGHTLSDIPAPFRTFFVNNGGVEVIGYPISEPFQEVNQQDGKRYWVQYFERQRLEYHPEYANTGYEVMPGLLGSELGNQRHPEHHAFRTPRTTAEPRTTPFIYGYNAMLYHDVAAWQDRERVLNLAKESGVNWIRQQVAWKDLHKIDGEISWAELDRIVDDVHNAGMSLLIVVTQAPWWATPNGSNGLPSREHFATFADFMGQMAARYQGKVQAYEIWNEPNLACQNGGDCTRSGGIGGRVITPDYYVDMLFAAYNAIKAEDPAAIVVSGSTASSEMNDLDYAISDRVFLWQMLNHPKFRADVVGVHPGDRNNPPDTLWPYEPGPGPGWQQSREFYFRRVEDLRFLMVEAGKGDKQMWITEFGWATPNITNGFEYGNVNSFEDQARWIVRAFDKGRYEYSPWVGAMFVWNLNFAITWKGAHNDDLHEQASYGVLNSDWSPRPAWYAIQQIPK
jgi:hypothetical protein